MDKDMSEEKELDLKAAWEAKIKYCNMLKEEIKSLESRLSQAEAENQVLRDENVAYNKNYLNLMDVARRMGMALEAHTECLVDCPMCKELASWKDLTK